MDNYYEMLDDCVFYERQLILLLSIINPEYLKVKRYTQNDIGIHKW